MSSEKLQAQSMQVTSVGETVNQLSAKLMSLLPTLSHSASDNYPRSLADFPVSERLALGRHAALYGLLLLSMYLLHSFLG